MSATFETGPNGGAVLVVRGEIDLANAAELDAALAARPAAEDVTVDLSAAEYLDSAGIQVLFEHARGRRLRVLLADYTIIGAAIRASRLDGVAVVEVRERGS
jgi:anti-anti-sigma factor